MAKYRYINTAFWDDYYISSLDPSEKLLFLYLISNPATNMLGVYQIPLKRVALDTGFDLEMVKKLLQRFADDGKAFYEVGWVVMKNHLKNQKHLRGPKIDSSVRSLFKELPNWLKERLTAKNDTLYIPLEGVLYQGPTNGDGDGDRDGDSTTANYPPSAKSVTKLPTDVGKGEDSTIAEFGDPQVNQVFAHFEKRIGKMARMALQRRAAKTLLQRHGFEKVVGGINAVAACRGEQFAPTISSLVALRDKWVDLETFYLRQAKPKHKGLKIA